MRHLALVGLLCGTGVVASAPVPAGAEDRLAKTFGQPVDPDKDCRFGFDGGVLTVRAGAGPHDLHPQLVRMNAPRTLREADGDFTVEVKATPEYPAAARPAVPGRNFLFHSQGLLLWADDKTFLRLEHARVEPPGGPVSSYVSYELFTPTGWARAGTPADGVLDPARPTCFRLVRRGQWVAGACSQDDGLTWRQLPPLELDIPTKVHVGVVVNHNTDAPFAARFEEFALTPRTPAK